MAVIDFSNAVVTRVGAWDITNAANSFLGLKSTNLYSNSEIINENSNTSVLINTADKVKVLHSGKIKSSVSPGTSFAFFSSSTPSWEISNISYSPGDTYAFTIEVDLTNL